jgi:predicted MPP superfamily phosphohydrolase
LADATNALRADLVLLTGDLIDLSLADLPVALDFVRRLDPCHGLVMCEGNHDIIDDATEFERCVKATSIPLLIDESLTLTVRNEPVQFLGLRWGHPAMPGARRAGGSDTAIAAAMTELLAQREPGAFPILLAHHPHAFDPAAAAGLPLTLSGHTHGGQIMLTDHIGFGPLMFRYYSGLYRKADSQLVVSNGVGNWFPLRVHSPAEIVHLTLRCPADRSS